MDSEGRPTSGISGNASSVLSISEAEVADQWREIAPYEAVACEILIRAMKKFVDGEHHVSEAHHAFPDYRPESMTVALTDTACIVRFNAKWFAPGPLSTLLMTAFDAVGTSSSSAELHAGLNLINNVATYSVLPSDCIVHIARFLSYAYYQGNRTNRTKKLADEAWALLARLLQSHIGGQLMDAFLSIIRDYATTADRRVEYASAQGSLMILAYQLFTPSAETPAVDLDSLIESLKVAAAADDNMLHEPISVLIVSILANNLMVDKLNRNAAWDNVLAIVSSCTTNHVKPAAHVRALIDSCFQITSRLEPRCMATLGGILLRVHHPLTPQLERELLLSWAKRWTIPSWTQEVCEIMDHLLGCPHYLSVLKTFSQRSLTSNVDSQDDLALQAFLQGYVSYMQRGDSQSKQARLVLGEVLVNEFRRCAEEKLSNTCRNHIFKALCEAASHNVPCADLLFAMRADIAGEIYFLGSDECSIRGIPSLRGLYASSDWPIQHFLGSILATMREGGASFEEYEFFLAQIPQMLGNKKLLEQHIHSVRQLKNIVCDQLDTGLGKNVRPDNKAKVTARLLEILTIIVSYHRDLTKDDMINIVAIFTKHAGAGDPGVSVTCVHGLTICCYEVPDLMSSHMDSVIEKMSKMVTQRFVAIHVLQFLASLSRLPNLYRNFRQLDYKRVFAVCQSYLQSTRNTQEIRDNRRILANGSTSNGSEDALPQYVYALAHHVVTFWYIAMSPHDRADLKPYITNFLTYRTESGEEALEDQGIVTVDMMDRIDAEESSQAQSRGFDRSDGRVITQTRLAGLLLVTTQTSLRTGKTLVSVRRPSGNSHHLIDPSKTSRESRKASLAKITLTTNEGSYIPTVPEDMHGNVYGQVAIPEPSSILGARQVIALPQDDGARRAIESLDRTPALDSHKSGVIYIGEGQNSEDEILRNSSGSPDYTDLLRELGNLQVLKGAKFNTQGLDRDGDYDGAFTIVWNNNVTELVYHITTMMPTSDDVRENTPRKKRHIGNDFVNIVFNNSGARLTYDALYKIFPSDFGYVYIVITPSSRTSFIQARTIQPEHAKDRFYNVNVLTKPDYPNVSPASVDKTVSGVSLAGFVRNLALNDCIVSLMKSPRGDAGEYPSSWRDRMQQLRRMAVRYQGTSS